jgi:hypothetical protein
MTTTTWYVRVRVPLAFKFDISVDLCPHTVSFCTFAQIFDVPWKGMPVRRRRVDPDGQEAGVAAAADNSAGARRSKPIYSIVKHYPPDWQVKLANEASAAATVKMDQVSL